MTSKLAIKLLPRTANDKLRHHDRGAHCAYIFHLLRVNWVKSSQTKPVAGFSNNKHGQTSQPVFGAQALTKLSLRMYFLTEIRKLVCVLSLEKVRQELQMFWVWLHCYRCSIQ